MADAPSAPEPSFRIRPLDTTAPPSDLLPLLDEAFGSGHTEAWFDWKHRRNPAGPSLGWVATDDRGTLGLRLFMRWNLDRGGTPVVAARPVDTVTARRARRTGVFSRLTRHSLDVIGSEGVSLIFNTPNTQSRDGYRRLGWELLDPIAHSIRPLLRRPGKAQLTEGAEAGRAFEVPADQGRLHTSRSAEYIRWRYLEHPSTEYRVTSLTHATSPLALVSRLVPTRFGRLLVACEATGTPADVRSLVAATARSADARAWLDVTGPGARPAVPGRGVRRGGSLLAVLGVGSDGLRPYSRADWALSLGDLEGTI